MPILFLKLIEACLNRFVEKSGKIYPFRKSRHRNNKPSSYTLYSHIVVKDKHCVILGLATLRKTKLKYFMQYKLEKISAVQDCDILLAKAEKKKQILDRKRRRLGESIDIFRAHVDCMTGESVIVQASLEAFKIAYQALPEGKDKANINVKIKRLELRQAQLEKKAYTYNVAALLIKELKYNRLDSQVLMLENYIIIVKQKRVVLGKAALRINRDVTLQRIQDSRETSPSKENVYAYPVNPNLIGSTYRNLTTVPLSMAGFRGLRSLTITRRATIEQPVRPLVSSS
jgi:hypothetical protein